MGAGAAAAPRGPRSSVPRGASIAARRAARASTRRPSGDPVGVDRREVALPLADPAEGGGDPVVLGLADRVELVVVAAGAVDGQAEEGLADGADDVLELVARTTAFIARLCWFWPTVS